MAKSNNVKDKTESKGAEGGGDNQEVKNAEGGDNPDPDKPKEDKDPNASRGALFEAFAISLGLKDEPKIESLLDTVDFDGIIKYIQNKKATNIVTMAGAGISTSAGIPDFRSPGTGLYDNLQKYNLPDPQAVFSIDYYKENPEPFTMLAKELWPESFKPTLCHYFIRLLHDKGILLRHYTQNIDTLETVAGLPEEKCVEAHGHFRKGHCLNENCKTAYSQEWMKERVMKGEIMYCTKEECRTEDHQYLVKPDIVFFGEPLPARFAHLVIQDFKKCDLLIIMGTSLVVQPFASLASRTEKQVPRLYINLENSCPPKLDPIMTVIFGDGFDFGGKNNYRDVFWQGTCDDGCQAMAGALGWGDELKNIMKTEHAKIDAANPEAKKGPPSKSPTEINIPEKDGPSPTKSSDSADKNSKKAERSPSKTETTKKSEATPNKSPDKTAVPKPKTTPGNRKQTEKKSSSDKKTK